MSSVKYEQLARAVKELENLQSIKSTLESKQNWSLRMGDVMFLTYYQCGPIHEHKMPEIYNMPDDLRAAFLAWVNGEIAKSEAEIQKRKEGL